MTKPVVGVIGNLHRAENRFDAQIVGERNLRAVAEVANALPLMFAGVPEVTDIEALLSVVDGILLTGGRANVHPTYFNTEPHPAHEPYDQNRDAVALAVIRMAVERGVPLLGICRGFQEINVAFGGSLHPEIRELPAEQATARMQEIYAEPIKPELITQRLKEVRAAGVTVAGALSPQRTQEHYQTVVDAGVDLFVIRGTTVSAEHVSGNAEPLNLKRFIYDLDVPVIVGGASTYQAALHLMRTGAAGVLVGFGGGAAHTTRVGLGIHAPMATAVSDVAAARRDYLDESGGRYVHVIADGGLGRSGDLVKAFACGADAVMLGAALARSTEAPGGGFHWGQEAYHGQLPRGERVEVGTSGTLDEILNGPGHRADGTTNIMGALRRSMATTGYSDLKEFQRVDIVVSPYHPA